MLLMGNAITELTKKQIDDLGICLFDLIDFDYDEYIKVYNL